MIRKSVRRVLIAVLATYWISMYVGTHVPTLPSVIAEHADKLLHCCAYGGLAFLLILAIGSRQPITFRQLVFVWFLVAGYGVFDEVTQPLVGRHADLVDWVADIFGAAIGLLIGWPIAARGETWVRRILRMPKPVSDNSVPGE